LKHYHKVTPNISERQRQRERAEPESLRVGGDSGVAGLAHLSTADSTFSSVLPTEHRRVTCLGSARIGGEWHLIEVEVPVSEDGIILGVAIQTPHPPNYRADILEQLNVRNAALVMEESRG